MIPKKAILPLFIILALVQLFVPLEMITSNEKIIDQGTTYKFRTAPIDPSDPLRGKYISLRFLQDSIRVEKEENWQIEDLAYCLLKRDQQGFASFHKAINIEPPSEVDFLKLPVETVSKNGKDYIRVQLPFNRFYMEESKAYEAELVYRASMNDTTKVSYALVAIKDGAATLKDVMINETSIKDLVIEKKASEK